MKAKTPIGWPGWQADDLTVLLDNALGIGAREEVQIKRATDEAVLN
jgi:hypothetical protein